MDVFLITVLGAVVGGVGTTYVVRFFDARPKKQDKKNNR